MAVDIVTHCVVFVIGVLTGAFGRYLGDKCTDRRRDREIRARKRAQFHEVQGKMPKLLVEMKHDLAKPEHCDTREFFISQREWLLNAAGCFVYYENDHPGLQGKIHVLENLGYVVEITAGDTPKYRMTEEFVQLVLAGR